MFKEEEVRSMGRTASGVKGMNLEEGGHIVGVATSLEGENILSVSDNLMNNVKYKVEEFTGMTVDKINIFVEGVRVID